MTISPEDERLIKSLKMRKRSVLRTNCIIPFFFLTTIVVIFWILAGRSTPTEMAHHIVYSAVTGYFLQDDPATEPLGFDYTTTNFGLIDRSYEKDSNFDPEKAKTQWQRFENEVLRLNAESPSNINYKVFFAGRHGEGYHNVAEAFYGTKDWDCYWSLQDGNSTSNWVDAELTSIGIAQAQKAHDFWLSQITNQKIPFPQSYYSSPLRRCCATGSITFSGLPLPSNHPYTPLIKELFREVIGAHTCDKRSSKCLIHAEFPTFKFEEGFKEEDPLFRAEERETDEAHDQRTKKVLDDVFSTDKNTWISLSSHSGAIESLLRVISHRPFRLGTGQVIPVLIKAESIAGEGPKEEAKPWMKIVPCKKPEPPVLA